MEDDHKYTDLARQTRESVSALARRMRQERPAHGLGLTSTSVLSHLVRTGPLSPKELATRDYRPRALAEKAAAGFSLYSRSEDSSRLRRILDERELTAGILSL